MSFLLSPFGCGGNDPRKTIDAFASQGSCTLTLYEGGRHWLRTEEELSFMREWERKALSL